MTPASGEMNRLVWLGMLRTFATAQAAIDGRSVAEVEARIMRAAQWAGPAEQQKEIMK